MVTFGRVPNRQQVVKLGGHDVRATDHAAQRDLIDERIQFEWVLVARQQLLTLMPLGCGHRLVTGSVQPACAALDLGGIVGGLQVTRNDHRVQSPREGGVGLVAAQRRYCSGMFQPRHADREQEG
jgi:hypothetical protein